MNIKSEKHAKELKIFNMVYGNKNDLIAMPKDKPDIWVDNLKGENFGVEITELYKDQSEARLNNVKGYLNKIINLQEYIHKHDKENLKKVNISYYDKSRKEEVNIPSVLTKAAGFEEYFKLVELSIIEKSSKSKQYNKNLNYHNLIIHDNTSGLKFESNTVINFFSKNSISEAILGSSFEEIYLITFCGQDEYVLPLKRGLYIYNIYLFDHVVNIAHNIKSISDELYYDCMFEFLDYRGFKKIRIINNENIEIIYANSGFVLQNEKIIFNLYDRSLPPNATQAIIRNCFINHKTIKLIKEIELVFELNSNIGFKVAK
ncbi:hypothetical protein J2X69_002986 [Algoriphagus sp. 4150]|uniref:hypothetical protein n=1 Tax=Algoriphagus sp. 4150 TaxID=2817756 RepID=UPI002856F4C9|nr:hypothetical protein [Algoriphagus sp. 4150]MDR7130630.1 hypothetical protein [Algoriphagus sp. 4150]